MDENPCSNIVDNKLSSNNSELDNGDLDGMLDDKLLDAVTPHLALLDEVDDSTREHFFCSRCRTISSSLLSTPSDHICPDGHNPRDDVDAESNSRFYTSHARDDVPLIGDEDGDVEYGIPSSPASVLFDHCHIKSAHSSSKQQATKRLAFAAFVTLVFMIGEAVGGYFAGSIAIISDAAHLFSDLSSFFVALASIHLAKKPPSRKMSFGYHRAEVLGALVSVIIIWVLVGILVYEAVKRAWTMDFDVNVDTMLIVSCIGVFINVVQALVLHPSLFSGGGHGHSHGIGGHGHSHGSSTHQQEGGSSSGDNSEKTNINIRAAYIHILGDILQSVGVVAAAYIIYWKPEWKVVDPICTFIFSIIVIITTVPIITDVVYMLMEGTPQGIDYVTISNHLSALPGVKMVHSLHVWSLTADHSACSVHLAISTDSDSDSVLRDAQRVIRSRYHIYDTTIQVETYDPLLMDNCLQCQPISS